MGLKYEKWGKIPSIFNIDIEWILMKNVPYVSVYSWKGVWKKWGWSTFLKPQLIVGKKFVISKWICILHSGFYMSYCFAFVLKNPDLRKLKISDRRVVEEFNQLRRSKWYARLWLFLPGGTMATLVVHAPPATCRLLSFHTHSLWALVTHLIPINIHEALLLNQSTESSKYLAIWFVFLRRFDNLFFHFFASVVIQNLQNSLCFVRKSQHFFCIPMFVVSVMCTESVTGRYSRKGVNSTAEEQPWNVVKCCFRTVCE